MGSKTSSKLFQSKQVLGLWDKLSTLMAKQEYFGHVLEDAKTDPPENQSIMLDSFRILSDADSLLSAVTSESIGPNELAQAQSVLHNLGSNAGELEARLSRLNSFYNAYDLYGDYEQLKEKTEDFAQDCTVAVISGMGTLNRHEEQHLFATTHKLESQLYSLQRKFGMTPALSLWAITAQKNLFEFRSRQNEISKQLGITIDSIEQRHTKDDLEGFKVKVVKAMLGAKSGKLMIDRKHLTIKSGKSNEKIAFEMDANGKAACLSMFESTSVKGTLESIRRGSDDVVVAHFEVEFQNDSPGSKPSSISVNIGDRRHEGNSIIFSPIRMRLPEGQVEAISSIEI